MTEISTHTQAEPGLALVPSDKKISIHSADLALKQARKQGRPDEIAIALIRLAHLHFRQGRYGLTHSLAEEVLCQAPSDSPMRCDALRMLGNCAAELGNPDLAENYYHQAIDLARQLDYHYALYKCLHSLATNIYWPHGAFELCLAAGKEALLQAQALGLGEDLWFPLSDIAWVYWSTGQCELANQVANQMEEVISPGSLGEGFYCCLRAGLLEPGAQSLKTALALYERARSIAEATGDPGLAVEVRLGLCRCHRAAKNFPTAAAWAEDAVASTARLNYRQFQALAWIELARTVIELGDPQKAEQDLRAALEIAKQLRSNFDLARASLYLAVLLSTQKKPEANANWQELVQLITDNGYTFLIEQERSLVIPWIAAMLDSSQAQVVKTGAALFELIRRVLPAAIQAKTFGQFTLQVGAELFSKESLRQRRAGELLALLISSRGYCLSAGQVTEALCPDKDPEAAAHFYHHAISALRRLLEPDLPDRRFPCRYLEVSDEQVTLLLPAGSKIDFLEFEQAVRDREWEKAVGIYQGEYLPMYGYQEWTLPLRQHYADLFEQALLSLAAERLDSGAALDCLDLAQRALLHNHWQEQAVQLGMRAALELGDRTTAIKLYHRLEKTLDKELGLTPQKELQQLYARIRKRSGVK